jgi:acetyl esterase/lipase
MYSRVDTIAYGNSPDQVGDLYLPEAAHAPVICLFHGGYWRVPYGRDHIAPLAIPLAQLGFAVWNLEYRRVGNEGGGWPGTLEDVGAGIDHLATMAAGVPGVVEHGRIDLDRVTAVGHSAGGHLALWSAAAGGEHGPKRVRVAAAVGLAPVADLVWAYAQRCGNGAVENLLGGSPLGVPQLLVHGTPDEDVPVEISRRYARAAVAAGDKVSFVELPATSHMDFVDACSEGTRVLFDWLAKK